MDSLGANDSKEAKCILHPVLCSRCQRAVNTSFVDDYATLTDRELQSSLAKIDDELSVLHKKRLEILRALNHRTLINQLPFELISRILSLSAQSDMVFDADAHGLQYVWSPLLLGAVCKEWRDITVETPHLWSTITIYPYNKSASWADIVDKWLQRSGNLPLSIILTDPSNKYNRSIRRGSLDATFKTLRTCSFRWKSITVDNIEHFVFCDFLRDIQETPPIETIWVDSGRYDWSNPTPIPTPFRPKTFQGINMYSSGGLYAPTFLQCNTITHLDVDEIPDSDLIYIIQNADNIEHCVVHRLRGYSNDPRRGYPSVPIVNRSLKHLGIEVSFTNVFIRHIILPSLETVECRCRTSLVPDSIFVDDFVNLINRSQASLREVVFDARVALHSFSEANSLWHPKLPGITHLKLNVFSFIPAIGVDQILQILAYDKDKIEHPSLHALELTTSRMTSDMWSHFTNVFPQIPATGIHDDKLSTNPLDITVVIASTSQLRRPLSKASVILINSCDGLDNLELHHYLRLLDIQKSGVELELKGPCGVDLLQSVKKMYEAEV